MKEGAYCLPFINMPYMVRNFDWFPTSHWQIVCHVTLDTGSVDVAWSEHPGVVELSQWSWLVWTVVLG